MSRPRKTLDKVLSGTSDASIRFSELCSLMRAMDFEERVRGSHHIFSRANIVEIINLQPRGSLSKPYQVKQVREIFLKYRLGGSL